MAVNATFEAGKTYCDIDHEHPRKILARTAKTATTYDINGNPRKCKIYVDNQGEYIFPDGNYRCALVIHACRPEITEQQHEASAIDDSREAFINTRNFIKNNENWTSEQVWKIIDTQQEIKARGLRDPFDLLATMPISQYLFRPLDRQFEEGKISYDEISRTLINWLAFFGVECRKDWDLEDLLALIDYIAYWINEYEYNEMTKNHPTNDTNDYEQPEASASTPEAFKINPDLAPDFDAAFDECSYSPDYQANRAVFDDEPQSRRLVIRRRPAPAGRKLPTPKSRRQVYDFSKCADAETLRKALNKGDIDTIKAIAESYREFQTRTDGKAMTKTDYVTAIVKLYFPDYQPKAPTQEAIQDFHGIKFTPGKIYVLGSYYDIINNRSPRLFKVIRRNKSSIVIQEISNPDFMPAIGTECKTIKTCNRYPFSEYISFSRYSYDNLYAYWDYDTIYPYSPGYDIDFDETAYTPERQDNLAVLDDIPADHEPDNYHAVFVAGMDAPEWRMRADKPLTPANPQTSQPAITALVQEVKPLIIAHLELQPLSAEWDLLHAKFAGECTDIDVVREKIRLANTCINLDTVRAYQEAHAQHVPVEAKTETTPAKTSTKLPRMERCPHCGSLHKPYFSYRKQNNYSYTRQHFGSDPSEWTVATLKCRDCRHTVEEYFEALYGQPFPSRQEAMKKVIGTWSLKSSMADKTTWKIKPEPVPCVYISDIQPQTEHQSAPAESATVSKSAPKPATRKPRHAKKLDTSKQILIQFDEPENTPAPASTPAKPKTRRTRTPRVKRDYSRQILIDFGKDIPDCQINQRQAA